jgi:hypothetical protein
MSHTITRLLLLAAVVAAAGTLSATAAGNHQTASVACGRQMTLLFWPKGNPDLSAIGQPPLAIAHLDIYRSFSENYPLDRFMAWAAAGKVPASTPSPYINPYCISTTTVGKLTGVASPVRLTTAARLLCSARKDAMIVIDELGRFRYRVRVIAKPRTLIVDAMVAPTGSTLTYARGRCTKKSPPA